MSGRINGEMTVMHGRAHNTRRFPYDKIRITQFGDNSFFV